MRRFVDDISRSCCDCLVILHAARALHRTAEIAKSSGWFQFGELGDLCTPDVLNVQKSPGDVGASGNLKVTFRSLISSNLRGHLAVLKLQRTPFLEFSLSLSNLPR